METADELIASRRQKLQALVAQGIQPYGGRFPKTQPIQSLVAQYHEGGAVTTAGRLTATRSHGAITFADLRDASGKIQLCLRQERLGQAYGLFDMVDLGDWLGVEGALFKTKTGEVTIEVARWTILSKSLRPLPEKWHGLKDVEIRYRQRYLDLIANESVRRTFEQRARLLESLRSTMSRHGYLEVETPMMHAIPGGAAGEPFVTHHQALKTDLYLRLAPELHLKRLLVGGWEKVYEVNRSFRNEGLSTKHNPEFTMLEAYCAYEDYSYMMTLVKEVICDAARQLVGRLQLTYQGRAVNLDTDWEVASFAELLKRGYGLEPQDGIEAMREKLKHPKAGFRAIELKGQTRSQMLRVVEQLIEPQAKEVPVFVIDYWTELSPLAKSKPEQPQIAERFELFIGGMEVANAYSELNDPIEQRRRFEEQREVQGARPPAPPRGSQAGAGKAQGKEIQPLASSLQPRAIIDEDFLEALEYGMPPATGLGVGVDRLAMLLCDQPSIKDVILFPTLKPEKNKGDEGGIKGDEGR